jgi:hypothetical protein
MILGLPLIGTRGAEGDAYVVLAPVVEGFPPTEQFPELTEAQAVLAALSS